MAWLGTHLIRTGTEFSHYECSASHGTSSCVAHICVAASLPHADDPRGAPPGIPGIGECRDVDQTRFSLQRARTGSRSQSSSLFTTSSPSLLYYDSQQHRSLRLPNFG